jgi:hypothetical protein
MTLPLKGRGERNDLTLEEEEKRNCHPLEGAD